MSNTASFFTDDHRRCDESWAALETFVTQKDSAGARKAWDEFKAAMARHFAMEEEVLFPAFENATGMHGGGPTMVMRHEHVQMRAVLAEMAQHADAGRYESVLDHGDTLMMLIQQHNAKEETILYPMADRVLANEWQQLEEKLRAY
jgi:hemerythrin-like domain-containing protein